MSEALRLYEMGSDRHRGRDGPQAILRNAVQGDIRSWILSSRVMGMVIQWPDVLVAR